MTSRNMYYHSVTVVTWSVVTYTSSGPMQFYILFPLMKLDRIIQYSTILEQPCTVNSIQQIEDNSFLIEGNKTKVLKISLSGVYFHILKPQSMCWWRERWYPYFLMQLVIRRWTSCLSSSSNMAPKYPMRLSVNFWEAMSLRHSNWKKKKEKKKEKKKTELA